MRRALARGALVLAGMWLGAGCAPDPRARMRRAEDESRRLSAAILAAEQAVQPVAAYASELASPTQARGSFSMYYSPAALEQMAVQAGPYQMTGADFHPQLTGTITVERVTDFRFASRNRVLCRLHLRAENVRYTGKVPAMFKKEAAEFERAVGSGGHADVELQLTLQGTAIHAQARATSVTLRAKSGQEGRLLSAMNERAFNRPLVINMAIPGASQGPRRLLVTGNQVVVTYQ